MRVGVTLIWRTPPYPNYHWVIHPDVEERYVRRVYRQGANSPGQPGPQCCRRKRKFSICSGLGHLSPLRMTTTPRIEAVGRQIGKIQYAQDPMFQLRSVSCQFGSVLALKDCNLTIYPGERVALIGPSGAGKSTLLNLLNGSLATSTGEVWLLGQSAQRINPSALRRLQRCIGTVYQQHHLVGNLSVLHNVNAGHLGRWSLAKSLWSLIWPQEIKTAAQALNQGGDCGKTLRPYRSPVGGAAAAGGPGQGAAARPAGDSGR